MGLSSRRRYSCTTLIVITGTLYITALLLFLPSAPESEISLDELMRPKYSIHTRSQQHINTTEILRSNIREFEKGYVVVPLVWQGKNTRSYHIFDGQDSEMLKKKLFNKYSFNELKSSQIAVERRIPDNRPKK